MFPPREASQPQCPRPLCWSRLLPPPWLPRVFLRAGNPSAGQDLVRSCWGASTRPRQGRRDQPSDHSHCPSGTPAPGAPLAAPGGSHTWVEAARSPRLPWPAEPRQDHAEHGQSMGQEHGPHAAFPSPRRHLCCPLCVFTWLLQIAVPRFGEAYPGTGDNKQRELRWLLQGSRAEAGEQKALCALRN